VPTRRPSRSTVAREAEPYSSGIRWEIMSTATPDARCSSTTSSSRRVAASESELVASSRMSSRASEEIARAISTSCCISTLRRPTIVDGLTCTWRWSSTSCARRCMARQSTRPARRGRRPRKMFSATLSVAASVSSWLIVTMPSRSAVRGSGIRCSAPSTRIAPASGCSDPLMTRASVDLPEPFSPVSAWTSPGVMEKSTPSSARTPGNAFVTPRSSSSGAVAVSDSSVTAVARR
jgi:hypothetical protein